LSQKLTLKLSAR